MKFMSPFVYFQAGVGELETIFALAHMLPPAAVHRNKNDQKGLLFGRLYHHF